MKRSDLKKILMEEALKILAEKSETSLDIYAGMSDEEMKAAQATRNLSDRLRTMVDNYDTAGIESELKAAKSSLPRRSEIGSRELTDEERKKVEAWRVVKAAAEKVATGKPKPAEKAAAEEPKPAGMSRRGFLKKMMGKSDEEKPTDKPAAAEEEEEDAIYGLTSKKNPESLLNVLSKAGFGAEVVQKVVAKMKQLADDDNIVLEAVSLRGRGSEQDRVMNSESVGELISLVRSLGLGADQNRLMMKALNNWGNRNTVRFEKPTYAPAAPAAPEKPAAEPEKQDPRAAGGFTDAPDPAAGWERDPAPWPERSPGQVDTPAGDDPEPWYAGKDDPKPEGEKGAPEPEPEEEEKEQLPPKELVKMAKKKLDDIMNIADFQDEYIKVLKGTRAWERKYENFESAMNDAVRAIRDLKNNADDIERAVMSLEPDPEGRGSAPQHAFFDDESLANLKKIHNFGDREKMFTSRLMELIVAGAWVEKNTKSKLLDKNTYNIWKTKGGGQKFIDRLMNMDVAKNIYREGLERLQEQKTLNRWKLLAGIK